ncbi:MAG: hypothetical protein BMS9Abin36_1081 [Gammaproteobacteria bacterium]|nr:MAG: hypothetical protein BMS9Abin36_1081 [Gammaproteobacteria bacterium]
MAATQRSGKDNALPLRYKLGEYVIESVLGRGGFGITYLARDTSLNSRVAVKEYFPQSIAIRANDMTIIPRPEGNIKGAESYHWGRQEFLKEARALARFKHNNIVRVLRFLEANGTAYMVMEYEEGESLAEYLRKQGGFLNEQLLLSVFLPILSGLQAVHDAGLLHLDIKPDNIYLRSNGKPMLIDFGSAQTRKKDSEENRKIALTPGYAAVEHYPDIGQTGSWTDVYSIGATIYRCITGTQPVDALERYKAVKANRPDPLKAATSIERPPYSPYIRKCVDWALKLSPKARPHTAHALQEGLLGKAMTNEKKPQSQVYSFRSGFIGFTKVAAGITNAHKKKRGLLEKLFMTGFALLVISVVTIQIMTQSGALTDGDITKARQLGQTFVDDPVAAAGYYVSKWLGVRQRKYNKTTTVDDKAVAENNTLATKTVFEIVPFEPEKVLRHTLSGHRAVVRSLAFLMDGSLLASASTDGVVKLWNVETGAAMGEIGTAQHASAALAVSPDGKILALPDNQFSIALWDAEANEQIGRLSGHKNTLRYMAFAPDGKTLVSVAADKQLIFWDVTSQKPKRQLAEFEHELNALAVSGNGRLLVTVDDNGTLVYWDMKTAQRLSHIETRADGLNAVVFSPDGRWMAAAGGGGFIKAWSTGINRDDRSFIGIKKRVTAIAYSPDNKWLLSAGEDNTISMWRLDTGELVKTLSGAERDLQALVISADGKLLASAGDDALIRIWK